MQARRDGVRGCYLTLLTTDEPPNCTRSSWVLASTGHGCQWCYVVGPSLPGTMVGSWCPEGQPGSCSWCLHPPFLRSCCAVDIVATMICPAAWAKGNSHDNRPCAAGGCHLLLFSHPLYLPDLSPLPHSYHSPLSPKYFSFSSPRALHLARSTL